MSGRDNSADYPTGAGFASQDSGQELDSCDGASSSPFSAARRQRGSRTARSPGKPLSRHGMNDARFHDRSDSQTEEETPMFVARWQIDARFGHKQKVIDLAQRWLREIGSKAGPDKMAVKCILPGSDHLPGGGEEGWSGRSRDWGVRLGTGRG